MSIILQTQDLCVSYGDMQALFDINISVQAGAIVALIGANGAGKSTLLNTLAGLMRPGSGTIAFDGQMTVQFAPSHIAQLGIALVPEGRRLFSSLSIEENLLIGAAARRSGTWNLARIYELFPVLWEKRHAPSHSLSGGQQQMAAIGRALMANPRLLLCDEISLGLSPAIVHTIYAQLPLIGAGGTTIMLVEQDTSLALRMAQQVYCIREGRIVLQGETATLSRQEVSTAYFGGH